MQFKKLPIFILSFFLFAHEGHNHKAHSATSGIMRGSIIDEFTEQPKKYANISYMQDLLCLAGSQKSKQWGRL